MLGYFEGLDSERAIAWRTADSLSIRGFLGLELHEAPPDHSTVSRTRRLIDLETHQAVFTWVLHRLADAGLVKGRTIGIDATTLEANAALRSIVRRDTGETYDEFLTRLAQASGIETPTREDLARIDRMLRQSTTQGRAVLQRVLRGRLTFTPRADGQGYDFSGPTRFDKLFTGLVAKRPAFIDPGDRFGTEEIHAEYDADYGRLLEQAYGKGVASPAGFEPAFQP